MKSPALLVVAFSLAAVVCSAGTEPPAKVDTQHDACSYCRMAISDVRFAGQLVAPGEEPRFFDDIGCLVNGLKKGTHPSGAMAYVADHRTREWVAAAKAVYSRCPEIETPMSSHLIAHSDAASRDSDKEAARCTAASLAEVFGGVPVPQGK